MSAPTKSQQLWDVTNPAKPSLLTTIEIPLAVLALRQHRTAGHANHLRTRPREEAWRPRDVKEKLHLFAVFSREIPAVPLQ
jgi:hypothetical protein